MDLMSIDGYLRMVEALELQRGVADVLARGVPGNLVEIGSFQGRSTVTLARALKANGGNGRRLLTIDPHQGNLSWTGDEAVRHVPPTLQALLDNLRRFDVDDVVGVHVGTVDDAPLPEQIALAFVDGLHDEANVRHDAEVLLPRMAPGGLLCFHDYAPDWPGVVAAVNALYEQDKRLVWLPTVESLARLQVK